MRLHLFPLILLTTAGCLLPQPRNPKPPKARTGEQQERPKEVASTGLRLNWRERTPDGRLVRMLEMTAESGTLEGETQTGRLQRAKGILFRDDIPRARFTAPEVDADQTLRRVTARGGVTVTSIDPPGMVLKADVVTWYAKVNRVTATGNVTFVHTPNGETQVRATGGPFEKVVYDVETQAVTIPPRGGE